MIRGNNLLENISKLNTFVITSKSNNSLHLYLDKILNNKCKSLKFINDYDCTTLDLLYISLQIMNSDSKIDIKDFNKIDKKELKYYIDKTKGINYFKKQVPTLKDEESITNYIRTSLCHGTYSCNLNSTIKFENGLIVDAEWLVEFSNFIISSINNNKNLSNDSKTYTLKLVEIPEDKSDIKTFIKNIKLYEYNVSRKDNKMLTYQNIKYIIDILSKIDNYDFKELKSINSTLSKEKYILSINKINTNFNKTIKSRIEMLINESEDNNYYRLEEYIKDVLNCSNSEYRNNRQKLISTYDLLRSLAHAYKCNYSLEDCRKLYDMDSKEYEITFGMAISEFYLNYIYDENNLNNYFNYELLKLEGIKPSIIDYETIEYKTIISDLSKLNQKIVIENRKINTYLEQSKKEDESIINENKIKLDESCMELDRLVSEVEILRNQLTNIKDNNSNKSNINKTKIKYIKESIIKGTYKFDNDTTLITFDCYDEKDYHHTFHLEISLEDFKNIVLSEYNTNIRINFYQL